MSAAGNGGDSANVLAHLDESVIREQPNVVHLNCGLHDLKRDKTDGRYQVALEQYVANLERIVAREAVDAVVVFTVPPSHLRGIPTALRERFGVPVVFYDADVPMVVGPVASHARRID